MNNAIPIQAAAIPIQPAEITVNYIWLSSDERRQYAQDAYRYLCCQLQIIYLESDIIKSQG